LAQLAADDVVDLEYLRLARVSPDIEQHGPQSLAKGFELLPRVPDFTDASTTVCEEGDVVLQPLRRKSPAPFDTHQSVLLKLVVATLSVWTVESWESQDVLLRHRARCISLWPWPS
jgi:hypothetical protein